MKSSGSRKKTPHEPSSFLFEGILFYAASLTFIRLLPAVGGVADSPVLLFIWPLCIYSARSSDIIYLLRISGNRNNVANHLSGTHSKTVVHADY